MDGNLIFKHKKGQVTPIIIVAVLVVAGFLIYSSVGNGAQGNVDPEIEPIYNFVQECLKESAKEAILENSKYGGYFIYSKDSLDNGVPYYLKDSRNIMLTKERLQMEIADHINTEIEFCINDFKNFPSLKVDAGEIESLVEIKDNKVIINSRYPLGINKAEESYQLEKFNAQIDTKLGLIYDSVVYLMEDQIEHQDSLCVACANDVAETYNLEVSSINFDENVIIMTLKDDEVKIDNQALVFNYAIEYGK